MSVFTKEYRTESKRKLRELDKELGNRYRNSNEALAGETYSEFKKRVMAQERTHYPAWLQMPNETDEEFKRRIKAVDIDMKTIPAWIKLPDETEQEFKRRLTSKKIRIALF